MPVPAAVTEPHGDLPAPLTRLVGREREAAGLRAPLLDEGVRLLTLTGPGGVGKTRLAIEVASSVAAAFPDGVRFVALASVADPDLVAATVGQALGVREAGDQPLTQRLAAFLRDRRLLLLLDNFEQVVEAAPLVADLLAACPTLAVLVTSRVRLRLSGEREYAVAPLGLPAQAGQTDPGGVAESEAVRLFVERARAARADFALAEDNAEAVAGICRRLDGLPLALELAAARVKILPPPALLARLEKRLPLLTGGGRDLPARQRTMRDTIAWSHDLLTSEERALFRRLAVFAGGFTLEAAEAVAGSPDDPSLAVFDGVASLIDKSLLRRDDGPGGEPRYGMLETVREFGLVQLAATGEAEDVRRRHAEQCVQLAERVDESWAEPGAFPAWLAQVGADHANCRAALAWALERGDRGLALRLAGPLAAYWRRHCHLSEGRSWLEQCLAGDPEVPEPLRARGLAGLGLLAYVQGDHDRATPLLEAALSAYRGAGDAHREAEVLLQLGEVALLQRADARAAALLGESLALARALDPTPEAKGLAAQPLADLGHLARVQGDVPRAAALLEESLVLARESGQPFAVAEALSGLAQVARRRGETAQAGADLAEALPLYGALGDTYSVAVALADIATVAMDCGRPEAAARLLGADEGLREGLGASPWPVEQAGYGRAAAEARTRLGEEAFDAAWAAGRALTVEEAVAEGVAVAATLADSGPAPPRGDLAVQAGLTGREVEVLCLLVAGRSNAEIADRLFISRRTATTHVSHLYAKLGVASRAEAIALAHRHGLA